jgi:hypothetical protein
MASPRPWSRRFWGITLRPVRPSDQPRLIGAVWDVEVRDAIAREPRLGQAPSRALLFRTRREARTWCARTQAEYRRAYPEGHLCRVWVFRPVRVWERIDVV